ncbi:BTB/POZ and MATH domain-containing protein 1 [Dichanthelium oligosanthes]|uniref:BTB/POZ and MATH domain-containing protein 1 n=1 Tax=Dichanthelium oligosanthes TaxID=888268 RepID=A0A1E5WKR4_9POAL|nr:BTB/POZ and MATH domain-containing protein 1 [Dichanthelium oligosanthes]
METTTAALLSAAGRRISRCSASSIVWREVRGQHKLTIDGCIPSTKLPRDWSATSKTFEAGGYKWQITYEPYGYGNSWSDKYISVELVYGGRQQTDPLEFTFSLLDQAGKPVPRYSRSTEICFFNGDHKRKQGFHNFIRWKDLEESGCLRDNRFAIQCDITVIKDWALNSDVNNGGGAAAPPPARVVVPPSNLREHLNNLLWKKQGTDVTIHVGGEATFDAHGWLLAARSPVFEAALLSATKDDKVPGGGGRRRMEIQGVEPKVFKALLHFMYTDALPEMKERDTTAMAKGLLAAAHGYKLQRLKLMCEDMLCKRIEVNTVAENLVVAEQLGCRALKDACVEFISVPGNLKAVMETKGFEKIRANCPSVLIQIFL